MTHLGHQFYESGMKPNEETVNAKRDLKYPENQKQLKIFFGGIQYLAKILPSSSARTDRLQKLLKKTTERN